MRMCVAFLIVAFAVSSSADDGRAPSDQQLKERDLPPQWPGAPAEVRGKDATDACEVPDCPAQQESHRVVTEFDAQAGDAGRPEWYSPVEPGDPCDEHN